MKFGVREIANVVFKAKNLQKIGPYTFQKGQPVFYMDTAKTSTLEGAATTVYATGGRGNTRLIAWEGEKTLTFTVEDALLSPVSFAMLSGAGLLKAASSSSDQIHFHQTSTAIAAATAAVTATNNTIEIDLTDALESTEQICPTAPIYIMKLDDYGDITGEILEGWAVYTGGTYLLILHSRMLRFSLTSHSQWQLLVILVRSHSQWTHSLDIPTLIELRKCFVQFRLLMMLLK